MDPIANAAGLFMGLCGGLAALCVGFVILWALARRRPAW